MCNIKYGTSAGVYSVNIPLGNITTYSITGLTNGITYYFAVNAYNIAGDGSNSDELSTVPQAPVSDLVAYYLFCHYSIFQHS